MAEVVRIVATTKTETVSSRHGTKIANEGTRETVKVRSITCARMDVSALLDFADAVRAAGLSQKALVYKTSSQEGHLTGLHVDETRDVVGQGEAQAQDVAREALDRLLLPGPGEEDSGQLRPADFRQMVAEASVELGLPDAAEGMSVPDPRSD